MTESALTLVDGEPAVLVPVSDRGLAYGDGVFETIRVRSGRAVLLDEHIHRLTTGADRLGIDVRALASDELAELIKADIAHLGIAEREDGVVKIILTRGSGGRGYQPPADARLRRIVSIHDYSPDVTACRDGVDVMFCETPLSINPVLAGIKHLNRLEQVLASSELGNGVFEGLMCDTEGSVVEGTKSNLFAVIGGELHTPLIDRAGVEGVLRNHVISQTPAVQSRLTRQQVEAAEELFLCNSVFGIVPVVRLQARRLKIGPITLGIQRRVHEQLGLGV